MQDVKKFIQNDTEAMKYLISEVSKLGFNKVATLETEMNGTIYLYFYNSSKVTIIVHNNNKLMTIKDCYGDTITKSFAFQKKFTYVVRLSDHISKTTTNVNLDVILNNGNYAVFERDSKNIIKLT
jgi:hypothetical protein